MANRILLAADNSKNALQAVDYAVKTFKPDSTITLLSILPDPTQGCELSGPSLAPIFKENIEAFCTIEDAKKSAVEGFMEEAKKKLEKAGFPDKNIAIRVRKKKSGIARDIVKEATQGKYDTLVIGRRGLTGIKRYVFDSVSNKILQLADNITVTVVD